MRSIPILRIELQGMSPALMELATQLPFEQGLDEQGDEKGEHVGLDSANLLKQQWCGPMDTLELAKPFFESGRALRGMRYGGNH